MAQSALGIATLAVAFALLLCVQNVRSEESASAPNAYLFDTFDNGWKDRWIHSSNAKYTGVFKGDHNLKVRARRCASLPQNPMTSIVSRRR